MVSQLPETYQPIYGHPALASSRVSDDSRVDYLVNLLTLLSAEYERPLRILDLGSAQGYVAFRLAERSHHVTGIDYLPINVAVSEALAVEHPDLDVTFIEGDLVDAASLVELDTFDLVIGFAVLHHIAYRDGHGRAVELVSQLMERIPHAIFEMALSNETMYWAEALPLDPRITLAPYPFIRELGRTSTHLGDVRRPILYCSRLLALANGGLAPIQSWFEEPHTAAPGLLVGARRYFMLPDGLMILTGRFSESLHPNVVTERRIESRRCADVLEALADTDVEAPDLLEFVDGPDESVVMQSLLPGQRLDEIVGTLDLSERIEVMTQVMSALAKLEEHGLYHEDLRLWNVLWDTEKRRAHLIDFGAISDAPGDVSWPSDGYFSILAFIVALWGIMADQPGLRLPRASRINSAELPNHVTALVSFLLLHPRDDRVIRDLLARWRELTSEGVAFWPEIPLAWEWLAAVEIQRDDVVRENQRLTAERDSAFTQREALTSELETSMRDLEALALDRDQLASSHDELLIGRESLRVERDSLLINQRDQDAVISRLLEETQQSKAQLEMMERSKSWRLTAPFRRVRSLGKRH